MNSATSIDSNTKLRNSLIDDLLSEKLSIEELSKKYSLEPAEIFIWLKNLDERIRQTIEDQIDRLRPVDDDEWLNMSEKEKDEFIAHLNEADRYESKNLTIEDIKKMRRERKNKNT